MLSFVCHRISKLMQHLPAVTQPCSRWAEVSTLIPA